MLLRCFDVLQGGEFEVLQKYEGKDLVGLRYEPLFDFFVKPVEGRAFDPSKAWRICSDDYVTDDSGTGIKRRRSGHNQHTKANAASARNKAANSRALRAQAARLFPAR